MWELNTLYAAYNYLMAQGTNVCHVHDPDTFVRGWVGDFYVQVNGWTCRGVPYAASYCMHVATAMGWFMSPHCQYHNGNDIYGGAHTAYGNGDIWVTTWTPRTCG